ncbi:recombinase family protein [Rhodococcus opacus]|uniref:recombinase family protein n=1 Tax=Rhodococcus opacus TaxID=37919 RepID=UPI002235F2E5|nr:recombinase family protein [Rhodococcus opacus]UZG56238.1 recombinase family protein [Rhodococcus opacus]
MTNHPKGHVLGYARVSTSHQKLEAQLDALNSAGVDRIFTDKKSGRTQERDGLREMLDFARAGDTVVVVALDRLGRSLTGIIDAISELNRRGINLRSLREGIDFTTSTGKMIASIFAALAEYEVDLKAERAAAAREAAADRGLHTGRPKALMPDQVALAKRMRESGESVPTICSTLKVSRATVYRALAA